MKTAIVVIALLAPSFAFSCPKGFIEYEGNCAYDPAPAESAGGNSANWTSDEKPSRHPEPEWQRGTVNIIQLSPVYSVDDEIAAAKKWDDAHGQPHKAQ